MLKITKGLKKKKKGKKSKNKEDELFDSAELEEYRRQQQQKQEEQQAAGEKSEESEEWLKFKALTSGVDNVLKKTQGDLDRIKSTSYFQKKPPGPSVPTKEEKPIRPEPPVKGKWVDFDENKEGKEEVVEESEEPGPKQEVVPEKEIVEEEEEEESEFEDDQDDIFDTSFVDIVASGEVKLAYVPDSPIEEDTGPDPFDTSIVDKVIKVDPKEKKRNLVNLGCAVEILTGKLDKSPCLETVHQNQHKVTPKTQDLLLGSFDDGNGNCLNVEGEAEPPPKTILDDDPVFEEETSAILGIPPVTPVAETKSFISTEKENKEVNLKSLVEEFVPIVDSEIVVGAENELDDEFAALAAESLSKTKPPPPRPTLPKLNPEEDLKDLGFEEGDDPFDTSFAAEILPGKLELKIIEKEILENDIPVNINSAESQINSILKNSELSVRLSQSEDFDNEVEPLSLKHRDLLGGSTTDLTKIDQLPIAPKSISDISEASQNSDPFDTSIAEVAPGKTELKYLEKELLNESQLPSVQVDFDNDFDPRSDEKIVVKVPNRPDNLAVGKRTSIPKVVAFDVIFPLNNPDLLSEVAQEENCKVGKPLTPYYPPPQVIENVNNFDDEADPFDTSFVTNRPGKLELKILEKELVDDEAKLKRSLSDPEFDPRQSEIKTQPQVLHKQEDILSGEVIVETKLHTPVAPKKFIPESSDQGEVDPFDTSIASDLVPGKAEIKVLETELILNPEVPQVLVSSSSILEKLKRDSDSASRTSSIADVLEQPSEDITVKPLTPLAAAGSTIEQDDSDPFDTSNIGVILPGKTEIKILESELLN